MLNSTIVSSPQHSRMASPIEADTPLPEQANTYLNAGNLPSSDNCRLHGGERRSVNTNETFRLLTEADPAMPDSQGNTLLCLAARAGNQAKAQQLIDRGADVHHTNLDGDNALILAAIGGHLTFIKWLDSHYPQSVNYQNYYAETALTLAARHGHQPLVQWLVSRDASVVHLNDQFKDALAEAVANGHLELAQWFAALNTDLRRVYPDGNNLFLHAVRAGRQDIAQWLEDSGVDSQQINESGDSAITLAARHGHHQLLPWLLAKNAAGTRQICRNGDSPLLIAARQGHGETVKLLVQHGADTRLVNYAGSNVLTLAATSNESLALWLCDTSTDIHNIDFTGNNAFTLAAQSGFFQLMQTLERLGINIHQVNHDNDNAFTLVAREGSLPRCQWLAGKGINIHQVNRLEHNAVTLAALAGSQPLLEWLCTEAVDWQQIPRVPKPSSSYLNRKVHSFNAAILAASAGHFTEAQWLMRQGLCIHQRDYLSRNGVIEAVRLGRLDAVQWFTARGMMPDGFPDGFLDYCKVLNYNAMSLATQLGHLHILQWLHQNGGSLDGHSDERNPLILAVSRGDLPMIQWLCQQGADVNRVNSIGFCVLNEAVKSGHLRPLQWLVGQGAKDSLDDDGSYALMLAARSGHNAIFRWLIPSEGLNDQQASEMLLVALGSGQRSLAVWLCLNVCKTFSATDSENCNVLMLAAAHGFLWLTQWLCEQTTLDINQVCYRGYTALMLAAANGHLPVVQWLYLEKNANLHQKSVGNADALSLAIQKGQTETANWLIDQGMVLNPDHFEHNIIRLCSNRNNLGLLQCLLRQQLPPELLATAMLDAAYKGDLPVLDCCFRAGISPHFTNARDKNCFTEAAIRGSLAVFEFLCNYSGGDVDVNNARKTSLEIAAECGNLHIIQWFWARRRLSIPEQNRCLLGASRSNNFHVVKWLHRQGANIAAKDEHGRSSLFFAVSSGNTPMLEWFCQQGEDFFQVKQNGKGALSLAIEASEPQVARWLFRRGFQLTKEDIRYAFPNSGDRVFSMIFKMTSGVRRATLFHSFRLSDKLRILTGLGRLRGNENLSEEEADANFARFNRYNDKTLEHKCLVAVAKLIGPQSGTLKAGLKVVDSLSIIAACKFNLRELVCINFENNQS